MQETQKEQKAQSEPPQDDHMTNSNALTLSSKAGHILKIESEIRKLKQVVLMEKQLKKNKEEFNQISNQIMEFQERVKVQRKEAFKDKIMQIEKRKHQRQHKNKQTNQTLAKIKEQHKLRRKNMESLINLYRQEYEQVYAHKLKKKKEAMNFNMNEIKIHQQQYMNKRKACRIKTQNTHRFQDRQSKLQIDRFRNHRYSPSSSNSHDQVLEFRRQLARKRKQYGESAQRQAVKIKISLDMIRKAKPERRKSTFDPNIDQYQNQKKKLEKPKLDTNFTGNVEREKKKQIDKIFQKDQPVKQKLTRLKNIAEGFMVKYDNGHDSALDKMCDVNLMRAQLLLDEK